MSEVMTVVVENIFADMNRHVREMAKLQVAR